MDTIYGYGYILYTIYGYGYILCLMQGENKNTCFIYITAGGVSLQEEFSCTQVVIIKKGEECRSLQVDRF